MDRPSADVETPIVENDDNSEQAEAGTQAQDVAQEARSRGTDPSEDSVHGGRPNPAQVIPDDTPDLVDRMTEMNRSGRIDMDAYAGEPQMDDEDDSYGPSEDTD